MNTAKGYYSLIQYCPDPSRMEAVNIGVVLFCPERRFLRARLARSSARVTRVFGRKDSEFLHLQKASLEARLEREQEIMEDLTEFESYVSRRAGEVLMTAPRPVKVAEPSAELARLFDRLVGEKQSDSKPRVQGLRRQLLLAFENADVLRLVQKPEPIEIPSLRHPVKAPFSYQNGSYNLIEPMQLETASPNIVFQKVSVRAVEGQFLSDYRHPDFGKLALLVVAKFREDQHEERQTAKAIFDKHQVALYTFDNLGPLFQDIKRAAALHH